MTFYAPLRDITEKAYFSGMLFSCMSLILYSLMIKKIFFSYLKCFKLIYFSKKTKESLSVGEIVATSFSIEMCVLPFERLPFVIFVALNGI